MISRTRIFVFLLGGRSRQVIIDSKSILIESVIHKKNAITSLFLIQYCTTGGTYDSENCVLNHGRHYHDHDTTSLVLSIETLLSVDQKVKLPYFHVHFLWTEIISSLEPNGRTETAQRKREDTET